ncbi:MAG: TolC family protein [Deltaproteobacteria bacterium]|nr:TolC family protein [Deltaproteobacteria bacterium]
MRRSVAAWAPALCAALAAPAQAQPGPPGPLPLGRELPTFSAAADPAASAAPAAVDPTGVLGLEDALAAALLGNPELASEAYELRAREAALLQAGRRPNPTLSLEVEDVLGSGELGGASESQTTLEIGQLVELGGKRAARVRLAEAERGLAGWDHEARRLDVFTATADAFAELLAAQERSRLAAAAARLAAALGRAARQRVAAGLASPAERIRADVTVAEAALASERAERAVAVARAALAQQWGGTEARFERAAGDLGVPPEPPPLDELRSRAAGSPERARWAVAREGRDAELAGARSARVPDVTLAAGPRYLAGSDDATLVFGASLPLPLWDRNDGAIAEARYRRARVEQEQRAAEQRADAELAAARAALLASSAEAERLGASVLPALDRLAAELRRGYEAGRNSQHEVLEAEAERIATSLRRVDALLEAQRAAHRLERLTGAPLGRAAR